MATEPLPDSCSWPTGDCCFTDETQRLRAEVDAFREDAANYYRVAKEADAQQAALRARVAELEAALRLTRCVLPARDSLPKTQTLVGDVVEAVEKALSLSSDKSGVPK